MSDRGLINPSVLSLFSVPSITSPTLAKALEAGKEREVGSPVDIGNPVVSSGYGSRPKSKSRPGASTNHWALDIVDPRGSSYTDKSNATSVLPGTVVSSGWQGGYGHTVVVDHGDGLRSRYSHLDSRAVKVGEKVEKGARLGSLGNTGKSFGPHLDFGITRNGKTVNPEEIGIRSGGYRPSPKSEYVRGPLIVEPVDTRPNRTYQPNVRGLLDLAMTGPAVGVPDVPTPQPRGVPTGRAGALDYAVPAPKPDVPTPSPSPVSAVAPGITMYGEGTPDERAAIEDAARVAASATIDPISGDLITAEPSTATTTPQTPGGLFDFAPSTASPATATTSPAASPAPELGGIFGETSTPSVSAAAPVESLSQATLASTPSLSNGLFGDIQVDLATPAGAPTPAYDIGPQIAATPVTDIAPATPSPNTAVEMIGRDPNTELSGLFSATGPTGITARDPTVGGLFAGAGPVEDAPRTVTTTSVAQQIDGVPDQPTAPSVQVSANPQGRIDQAAGVMGDLANVMTESPVAQAMYDIQTGVTTPTSVEDLTAQAATTPAVPTVAAPIEETGLTPMGTAQVSAPRQEQKQTQQRQAAPVAVTPQVATPQVAAQPQQQATPTVTPSYDLVAGISPDAASTIGGLGIGAPDGARLGYSPFGGATAVYSGAPDRVQIAATGPGLFGALGGFGDRAEDRLARAAVGRTVSVPAGVLGGLAGTAVAGPPGGLLGGLFGSMIGGRVAASAAQRAGENFSGQSSPQGGGFLSGLFGGFGNSRASNNTTRDTLSGSSRVGASDML